MVVLTALEPEAFRERSLRVSGERLLLIASFRSLPRSLLPS